MSSKAILTQLSNSNDLKNMWVKYQNRFAYAKDISYESIMILIDNLIKQMNI